MEKGKINRSGECFSHTGIGHNRFFFVTKCLIDLINETADSWPRERWHFWVKMATFTSSSSCPHKPNTHWGIGLLKHLLHGTMSRVWKHNILSWPLLPGSKIPERRVLIIWHLSAMFLSRLALTTCIMLAVATHPQQIKEHRGRGQGLSRFGVPWWGNLTTTEQACDKTGVTDYMGNKL